MRISALDLSKGWRTEGLSTLSAGGAERATAVPGAAPRRHGRESQVRCSAPTLSL